MYVCTMNESGLQNIVSSALGICTLTIQYSIGMHDVSIHTQAWYLRAPRLEDSSSIALWHSNITHTRMHKCMFVWWTPPMSLHKFVTSAHVCCTPTCGWYYSIVYKNLLQMCCNLICTPCNVPHTGMQKCMFTQWMPPSMASQTAMTGWCMRRIMPVCSYYECLQA